MAQGGEYPPGYYSFNTVSSTGTTWGNTNITYVPMPVQQPYMISPQIVALPQPDLRDDHIAWLRGRVDEIRDLVRAA